jgi:flagellar basal-body rod protein FlgF
MSGGTIAAASGMKAQMEALDMLANNLANMNTAGFKEQKSFFTILSDSINSSPGNDLHPLFPERTVQTHAAMNLTDGMLQTTQRDLDIALMGDGFLEVSTPRGIRYTRNGSLTVNAKSQLATVDGWSVMGEKGPILIGPGKLNITEQGEVFVNDIRTGRLKIVSPDNPASLLKEGNSLLIPSNPGAQTKPGTAAVRQGFLEQSNVNAVASMVEMVGILRRFEAIQKTVNLLLNDVDAKSIEKLGRY